MKDMTTAEFAKANLAALEEPVKVRRYTKTVGTYYPEGYIAALEPAAPQPVLFDVEDDKTKDLVRVPASLVQGLEEEIEAKNEEIARLKRELAARSQPAVAPHPQGAGYRPEHPLKDVFAGLAKQDREFFERKLGKAGKGK